MKTCVFLQAKNEVGRLIAAAADKLAQQGLLPAQPLSEYTVEIPAERKNGDFAANVALVGAKAFHMPPRKIAELTASAIDLDGSNFAKVEVAGPGFLNFFLAPSYYCDAVREVLQLGADFGKSDFGGGQRVIVEFVSANPTGPAHMGNARGGALGDCLSAIMEAAGYEIWREFYVNDAGNQIEKLAVSLQARYLQLFEGGENVEMPADSYHGEDVINHAKAFAAIHGDSYLHADEKERKKALVDFALPKNIEALRNNMQKYRINYDMWFYESSLYRSGEVERVIDMLRASDRTYERGGALWYMVGDAPDCPYDDDAASAESDDTLADAPEADGAQTDGQKVFHKDFVLVRSNGFPTYIVPDIAYHYNKLVTRGFERAINVLGSDHHGYMQRLLGILPAVGIEPDRLTILLMQMVKLTRDGEVVKMSKRTGKAITLTDLLDDIPTDAVRFLFNMRTPDSQMEFDLDLAMQQSSQNPVYYTQYAHARICSIIKNLAAEGITPREVTDGELALLTQEDELTIIKLLSTLPSVIIDASRAMDSSKVTRYAITLATAFHKFYTDCRVNCGDEALTQARLALCAAVRTALCNILQMLKISVPQTM